MVLELTSRVKGDITVVSLVGRLTLGNLLQKAEAHIKTMFETGTTKIVMDLSEVDYLDSAGIGMLMACAGAARTSNGHFCLAAPNDRVRKIFDIAHVGKAIPIYPDLDAATASLA